VFVGKVEIEVTFVVCDAEVNGALGSIKLSTSLQEIESRIQRTATRVPPVAW
jgi:hypothetical protein